jgi:hypothetical protein
VPEAAAVEAAKAEIYLSADQGCSCFEKLA